MGTQRCLGPQTSTLITSTQPRVTLTVAGKPISFLIDTGATYSAMPAYSRKTKISQVSVVGVDGLLSTPQITEHLPCMLQDIPFSQNALFLFSGEISSPNSKPLSLSQIHPPPVQSIYCFQTPLPLLPSFCLPNHSAGSPVPWHSLETAYALQTSVLRKSRKGKFYSQNTPNQTLQNYKGCGPNSFPWLWLSLGLLHGPCLSSVLLKLVYGRLFLLGQFPTTSPLLGNYLPCLNLIGHLSNSWENWLNWMPRVLPFLGSLLLLTLILTYGPCLMHLLSKLLQNRLQAFTNQTIHELFLTFSNYQKL